MKWTIFRDTFVLLMLFGLAWIIIMQYVDRHAYEYEIIYEPGVGHTQTLPAIAHEKPWLYWLYQNDWLIFIILVLCAIFACDWGFVKEKYKKANLEHEKTKNT